MAIVLLIRHGIAEDPRPGLPDPERPLTPQGWKRTEAAMRGLVKAGYLPHRGCSSGYRRAVETLACLQEAVLATGGEAFPIGAWEGLSPGGDPVEAEQWMLARIQEMEAGQVLAVVSHQPLLGELLYWLTGKSLEVKKASCSVLERRAGRWTLLRHYLPSELRGRA